MLSGFPCPSPPSPRLTSYIVCCVVHMPMPNCVCGGGGGAHMPMHVSSVLVSMSVCVMQPPPPTLVVCYLCSTNSTSLG